MITYLHKGLAPFRIEVRIDNKHVGDIFREPSYTLYYYKAKSGPDGDRFGTVAGVKASLEGETVNA